ncbi:MAG: hypothetical protein R3A44_01865 [Caldilineaceae bacterium]
MSLPIFPLFNPMSSFKPEKDQHVWILHPLPQPDDRSDNTIAFSSPLTSFDAFCRLSRSSRQARATLSACSISYQRKEICHMGRNRNDQKLDEIVTAIQANPESKAGTIGTLLGLDDKTMQRALMQLEDRGDLLEEDDKGRLRWFGKRQ